MNISRINPVIYKANVQEIKKNNTNNSANNSVKNAELYNNSISEVIGRSQVVSFSGENKILGPLFIHDCFERLGKRENIKYNKEDGSFVHTVYNRFGSISRKEEYFPSEGKEVTTNTDKYGTTILTESFEGTITEKLNPEGKQISWEKLSNNGDRMKVVTDYNIGRRIITEIKNGQELTPKVVDLRTGNYVTSGPLVMQRVYDKYSDMYITEDIITGQIHKEEKYGKNNKLLYFAEYNPITELVVHRKTYNQTRGGYEEFTYYNSGLAKSYVYTSKNNREIEKYTYSDDGKTITSHTFTKFDKAGDMAFERIYNPNTNRIYKETEINGSIRNIYLYNDNPNVPNSLDTYDNNLKVEHIDFQPDGKTYAHMTEYATDNSRKEITFNRLGECVNCEYYSPDNFMYKKVEYILGTEKPKKIIQTDRNSGEQTKYTFDDLSGEILSKKVTYADGSPKETTEYYPGGNGTPRIKKVYRRDGSYTATFYDNYGNQARKEEFNADNTRKGYRQQNNWNSANSSGYNYRTRTSGYNPYHHESPKESRKETLDKILSVIAQKSGWNLNEITDAQWDVLLNITGLKSLDELLSMSKDTYRHLTKKFHPDLNANNPNIVEYEIVFKILSNINETNKKKS